jgi:hypothetical protein
MAPVADRSHPDAVAYNEVVTGWSGIEGTAKVAAPQQRTMFGNEEE